MSEAMKIIEANQALRDAEEVESPTTEPVHVQTLQTKIENAAMVANRFGTPMDEAQRCMGMTDEQIENFKRS